MPNRLSRPMVAQPSTWVTCLPRIPPALPLWLRIVAPRPCATSSIVRMRVAHRRTVAKPRGTRSPRSLHARRPVPICFIAFAGPIQARFATSPGFAVRAHPSTCLRTPLTRPAAVFAKLPASSAISPQRIQPSGGATASPVLVGISPGPATSSRGARAAVRTRWPPRPNPST
jgi:hypothetical protein